MATSKRMVSFTSEELRAKSAAGTTMTDWRRVVSREPDMTDPDSPDISHLIRAATLRLRGRPKGSGHKAATSLRIDKDVLAAWRATGRGWQTRMNDALRAAIEPKPKQRRAATKARPRRAR